MNQKPNHTFTELSEREKSVLKGMAEGKTMGQIGDEIGISEKSVEYHRGNLQRKLNTNSVAILTRIAMRMSLISDSAIVSYNLDARTMKNGVIQMELAKAGQTLSRWLINTREQAIRDALISLGWTPPNSNDLPPQKPDEDQTKTKKPKHVPLQKVQNAR